MAAIDDRGQWLHLSSSLHNLCPQGVHTVNVWCSLNHRAFNIVESLVYCKKIILLYLLLLKKKSIVFGNIVYLMQFME